MNEVDQVLINEGIAVDLSLLKDEWKEIITSVLKRAKLDYPKDCYMHTGSNEAKHTEHLGHLLCEMQYLQRAYPDATW